MGIPAFVIGPSGSGKTYSIKNFKADEVGVISVEKGRLRSSRILRFARSSATSPMQRTTRN